MFFNKSESPGPPKLDVDRLKSIHEKVEQIQQISFEYQVGQRKDELLVAIDNLARAASFLLTTKLQEARDGYATNDPTDYCEEKLTLAYKVFMEYVEQNPIHAE